MKKTLVIAVLFASCVAGLFLRSHQEDLRRRRQTPEEELFLEGCRLGDSVTVRSLLDIDPTLVNTRNYQGTTALYLAADEGTPQIAELLISRGADVNARVNHSRTALHAAVNKFSGKQVAQSLLDHGADVNARTGDGETPLHFAANCDFLFFEKTLRLILDRGADVNARDKNGDTPLHHATRATVAHVRSPEGIDLIVDRGGDINAANDLGNTPLHGAVSTGSPGDGITTEELSWSRQGLVKTLLKRGADTSIRNHAGKTPLDVCGDLEVCFLLIAGSKLLPGSSFRDGYLLVKAAQSGDTVAAGRLLAGGTGASSPIGACGVTPLLAAIKYRQLDMVKLLLEKGADPEGVGPSREWPLLLAVRSGDPEIIDAVISHGAKVDRETLKGRTALFEAPNPETAQVLLDRGAEVDHRDKEGKTPLHEAVRLQDARVAEFLLGRGADPVNKANNGDTPLHQAAKSGNAETVKLLLASPGYLKTSLAEDGKILGYAISGESQFERGNIEVLKTLLAAGADPNGTGKGGPIPLGYAINYYCSAQFLKALLDAGANPNGRGDGNWPLRYAADSGRLDLVQMLLAAGADPNQSTSQGTPLLAALARKPEIMEALLEAGADPNQPDPDGLSPLHYLIGRLSYDEEVQNRLAGKVRLLLAHGADPNVLNKLPEKEHPMTVLDVAQAYGSSETVQVLVASGARENTPKTLNLDDDWTPLLKASAKGELEEVRSLVAGGADVNLRDSYGLTPLLIAAIEGNEDVVRFLVEQGADPKVTYRDSANALFPTAAVLEIFMPQRSSRVPPRQKTVFAFLISWGVDINHRGPGGRTALSYAAHYSPPQYVRNLLELGADPNLADNDGRTPIFFIPTAAQTNYREIIELLLNHGARVNVKDKNGWTPLHEFLDNTKIRPYDFIRHDHVWTHANWLSLKLLLDHGADVNARAGNGWTPLSIAMGREDKLAVKILRHYGAGNYFINWIHSHFYQPPNKRNEDRDKR